MIGENRLNCLITETEKSRKQNYPINNNLLHSTYIFITKVLVLLN